MTAMDMRSHYRNVYSQSGEDGLIEHVLAILGIEDGLVVEVGAWDGVFNSNTALLWRDRGFRAVLIEADLDRYRKLMANAVLAKDVRCVRARIEPTGPKSLDAILGDVDVAVMSIDVDGQDYAVWEALRLRPAVVVIEVDSARGPSDVAVDCQGASFAAMNALAAKKGYRLIDHCGNCVYVRDDLARKIDLKGGDAERFSCVQWGTGFCWYRIPFLPIFLVEYRDKLLRPNGNNPVRDRASGFEVIFREMDKLMRTDVHILETGCVRPDHGDLCFGDDGCATVIFDHLVRHGGGSLLSVDIDPEHVAYARSKVSVRTKVECADSVRFICGIPADHTFDLVYLDSFDIDRGNPVPAQVHHLKELCAVLKNVRPGAIIAVDDHDAFFTGGKVGKGTLVKEFMEAAGAELLHEGYQIVWRWR